MWVTNSPVLAALPGKFTHTRVTSHTTFQASPHFLCISLLSHILQAASGSSTAALITRYETLFPGTETFQSNQPWPGGDGAHQALSFCTVEAHGQTHPRFLVSATEPLHGQLARAGLDIPAHQATHSMCLLAMSLCRALP